MPRSAAAVDAVLGRAKSPARGMPTRWLVTALSALLTVVVDSLNSAWETEGREGVSERDDLRSNGVSSFSRPPRGREVVKKKN